MLTPFGPLPNRLAAQMSLAEQHEWLQRRISRRAALQGAGVLGASSLCLWAQPGRAVADPNTIYGRHTAFGSDPTTQMIVGFASRVPVRRASVWLDSGQTAEAEIRTVAGSPRYYLRARLEHLKPATEYRYTLHVDGAPVAGARFRTAPTGRAAFRFTAFGDQNVDADAAAVLAQLARTAPAFHLLAGDTCYADSSGHGGPGGTFRPEKWDRWLAQNESVTARLPWMVVPGNHEMEPGFALHGYAGMLSRIAIGGKSAVSVPVATSFRVGTVGFIGLDSNDVSNEIPANRGWTQSQQTAWLASQLAAYRRSSDIDFIIVFLHASPYSTSAAHGSEGGIREQWAPLFDRHQVDLVISGHNHCYQRALPLRGGAVTSHELAEVDGATATTYVTVGGGGAFLDTGGFRPSRLSRVATQQGPELESAAWSHGPRASEHCFLVADVSPSVFVVPARMRLRAVTSTGRTIDEWQIIRHPAGAGGSWPGLSGTAALAGLGAFGTVGAATARRRGRVVVASDDPPQYPHR